jgi:alcohol dehydrogenase (cytochrome c)
VVFFGDLGGNFYALDSATGQNLFHQAFGGGGIVTYTVDGIQKVAVAAGFTMVAWPTKPVTAKVINFGLDSAAAGGAPSAQ